MNSFSANAAPAPYPAAPAWPERIVYVCSATKGAVVNFAPLYHAGLERRVVGMVILVGASNPATNVAPERQNAVWPADRLEKFARDRLGLTSDDTLLRFTGDPDSAAPWSVAMAKAHALADRLKASLIINVTGGTKSMALGQVMAQPDNTRFIVATKSPLETREIMRGPDGLREVKLPAHSHLDIAAYFLCYDMEEIGAAPASAVEEGWSTIRSAIVEVAKVTAANSLFEFRAEPFRFQTLSGALRAAKGLRIPLDKSQHQDIEPLVKCCARLGVKLENEAGRTLLVVPDAETHLFLKGGWLEVCVHAKVATLFKGRNDVQLHANLVLRAKAFETKRAEIDLLVLKSDQAHFIEVKAIGGKIKKSELGGALHRLTSLKSSYAGSAGRVWLVIPFLSEDSLKAGEYLDRASKSGVTFHCGSNAVDALLSDLRELP